MNKDSYTHCSDLIPHKRYRLINYFICLILISLCFPINVLAAEVLQVRSSSVLQIGDRNRSYAVKLACIEVDPKDETSAKELLKKELTRNKKINIFPKGSMDGVLLAKVLTIDNDVEEMLYANGLGKKKC